jgi:hypothetical protein
VPERGKPETTMISGTTAMSLLFAEGCRSDIQMLTLIKGRKHKAAIIDTTNQ